MNNPDTELFFPMRAIGTLVDLREPGWQELVAHVAKLSETNPAKIAFSAMVIKLAGCTGCTSDSFRAMRGCTQCSRLVIKRYKGTDGDLDNLYKESLKDIKIILEKREKVIALQDK